MVSVAGAIPTVNDLVAVPPAPSLTCAVKVAVAADVGVPEMAPPAEIDKPAGSAPEDTDQA